MTTTDSERRADETTPSHEPTRGLYGWITHTELLSSNPAATKAWCEDALGWSFMASLPTEEGEYHMFQYSDQGGGGIRPTDPSGAPGSIPYVHVEDCQAAYQKALGAGAEGIMEPTRVMEGVTTALVRAPGGVTIGFSGP